MSTQIIKNEDFVISKIIMIDLGWQYKTRLAFGYRKRRNCSFIIHFQKENNDKHTVTRYTVDIVHCFRLYLARRGGGGGVLPSYITYAGMCRWTGYGFWPLCPKQSMFVQVCPKQGISFRVSLLKEFILHPNISRVPEPRALADSCNAGGWTM